MEMEVLERLGAVVEELGALGGEELGDPEVVLALSRQLGRLEAVVTAAMGHLDRSGVWRTEGARTPGAWLAAKAGLSQAAGRRRVRLARALGVLPVAAAAWAAGDLDATHVEVLARVRTSRTAGALARDEALLVGEARRLGFRRWLAAVAYWEQCADPDGTDAAAVAAWGRRRVSLGETDGGWHLSGWLDPVSGRALAEALGRVDDDLLRADWADAHARLGRAPTVDELDRSGPQRRADALVELAHRAHTAPPGARRPDPLISVFVGYETLAGRICELAGGGPVAPAALLPWLTEAWVRRVVFDGPARVLEVGTDRRLYAGADRDAIAARDRECFHQDLCDSAWRHLQIDHVHPWAHGGPTTLDNGRLACGWHNRHRHPPPP